MAKKQKYALIGVALGVLAMRGLARGLFSQSGTGAWNNLITTE